MRRTTFCASVHSSFFPMTTKRQCPFCCLVHSNVAIIFCRKICYFKWLIQSNVVHGLPPIVTAFRKLCHFVWRYLTVCTIKKTCPKHFCGAERVVRLFEVIKFFPPSIYFLWSDGLDGQNHFILNCLWLIACHWLAGIFYSTGNLSVFLEGWIVIVFEIITFFQPSSYFLWWDGFFNQNHCVVIVSLPLVGKHFVKKFRQIWIDYPECKKNRKIFRK